MARALSAAIIALLCGAAPALANPVQSENALPGTTAWNARANNYASIFASQTSIAPGGELDFHVSTPYRYRIVVYRLGWYGGAGGRVVACAPSCLGDEAGQTPKDVDPPSVQPLRAHWPVTDVIHSDASWTSGYYIAEAVQTNAGAAGTVATTYFVVRQPPDDPPSQILVQVPVNTWEAYNDWGGRSLYNFLSPRASRVSFLRPFAGNAQSPLWIELQMVRWLERSGYDVSYQTDADTDADPAGLLSHRLLIDNGHDEYWTLAMRGGWDAALAGGTNLAFMGANDDYWNIRYEDGGTTIYSEKSMYDPNPDPTQKTAMFREIGRPECRLEGVEHGDITVFDHPLDYTVTAAGAADPWLAGTGLQAGDTIAGVVGREHDSIVPGCVPAPVTVLFHYANPLGGPLNADAVKWTAPGGGRVFATGAYAFTLALDAYRSDGTLGPQFPVGVDRDAPVDPRVQRFMANALDDLTRPAPPARVLRVRRDGRWRVRTGWPDDGRVVSRLVYRVLLRDGSRTLVCSGHAPCYPPPAAAPGTYDFEVSYVDRWGAVSAPAVSSTWTRR
ncbi:MAG: N,N-dimethylformamidase beta subunit family domain-containing protein [Actinomycetota bacterium]